MRCFVAVLARSDHRRSGRRGPFEDTGVHVAEREHPPMIRGAGPFKLISRWNRSSLQAHPSH